MGACGGRGDGGGQTLRIIVDKANIETDSGCRVQLVYHNKGNNKNKNNKKLIMIITMIITITIIIIIITMLILI